MDDRSRAIHEAAHAATAFGLGHRRVGMLSIVPGTKGHGGFADTPLGSIPAHTLDDLALPYVKMPSRLKKALESRIMIFLGGVVGEALYAPRVEGWSSAELGPCETGAMDLATKLTAAERARLEQLRDVDPEREGMTDIGQASRMAYAAIGDELRHRLLYRGVGFAVCSTRSP